VDVIINGDARSIPAKEAWPWWEHVGISREEAYKWEAACVRYGNAGLGWFGPEHLWAAFSIEAQQSREAIAAFLREEGGQAGG